MNVINAFITKVSSVSPTMAQLQTLETTDEEKIKIIRTVASDWMFIGDQLDFDKAGTKLNQIKADCGGEGVGACCRSMFQYWLNGNGLQPVSWDTLIEILNNCNFGELAERVRCYLEPNV